MPRDKQLQALVSSARKVATTAPTRPTPRRHPGLVLEGPELVELGEMIAVGEIARQIARRHDVLRTRARSALFRVFTLQWWTKRRKPENPRIEIPDAAGQPDHDTLYQLRDQFSLASFANAEAVAEALAAPSGPKTAKTLDEPLSQSQAGRLVEQEIASDPILRLAYTLTELVEGHTEEDPAGGTRFVEATPLEKSTAGKLLGYLLAEPRAPRGKVTLAPLTEAERAHLLVLDPRLHFTDAKGFTQRLPNYVTSLGQLRRVLATFRAVQIFSSSHFAIGATNGQRTARLTLVAAEVLGNAILEQKETKVTKGEKE